MKEGFEKKPCSPRRESILPILSATPKTPRQPKRIHLFASPVRAMLRLEEPKQEKRKSVEPEKPLILNHRVHKIRSLGALPGSHPNIPKTPISQQLVHRRRTITEEGSKWLSQARRHFNRKPITDIPFIDPLADEEQRIQRLSKEETKDDSFCNGFNSKMKLELIFDEDSFSSWTMTDSLEYNARRLQKRAFDTTDDRTRSDSRLESQSSHVFTVEVDTSLSDCSEISELDEDTDFNLQETSRNFGAVPKRFESSTKSGTKLVISSCLAHVETNPAA